MLRWRLLVGLASLFLLLLGVGACSIWLILRLQSDVDSILTDNYESIREAHHIRLAMLRMNVAYMKPYVADIVPMGPEPLDTRYVPQLERSLAALRLLAKSQAERSEVEQLTNEVTTYTGMLHQILDLPPTAQDRYLVIRAKMMQLNLELTDTTERILAFNEDQMLKAHQHANAVASDSLKYLTGAMFAAIAMFAVAYYQLGRSLVAPIEDLTRSIDAIRAGRFEQNLPVHSSDELGRLARTFNAMAEELRSYRRDTDETILRLNRSLREAIAALPYPVMLLDAGYAIWVTNEAANKFLAANDSPSALPEAILRCIDEVRRTGGDYLPEEPRESLLFRIGERETHYLPRILRIFSPKGDVTGSVVILIDVTRFRWLDDIKTNMISTISHEIKTPLTGIRMILHLLLEKSAGDLTGMQDEMVQGACNDCERLLSTLNSLLDLSRMEAGRTQLDLRPMHPRELLDEARAAFQIHAQSRRIELVVHTDDKLPNVFADRARMLHVIGNFTSNALKFAPADSTVQLTADRAGAGFVRLSVIDSGPGVSAQFHARIFDKFFRTPGHRVEGAGLGLSIAREIVHAHDGRIGVESVPNVATRFYCELPAVT